MKPVIASKTTAFGLSPVRDFLFQGASAKEAVGIAGVLLIAFFTWMSTAGAYLGLFLVLCASVLQLSAPDFRAYWRHPSNIVFLILAFYVLAWECVMQFSGAFNHESSATKEWVLLLIPWCGYWLYRFPHLIMPVLFLAGLGLLIETLVVAFDQGDVLLRIFQGEHVFQAKAWGLYLSVVILGLIVFVPRFFSWTRTWKRAGIVRLIYITSSLWLIQCLVAAQARTAWVCFMIAVTIVLVVALSRLYRKGVGGRGLLMVLVAGFIFILTSVVAMNYEQLSDRFSKDRVNISKILAGENEQSLTYTSVTYRYLINKYGYELWLSSPVVGLGPQDSDAIIAKHENEKLHVLAHFHSTYIEILVQLGVVGLVLLVLAVAFLWYQLLRTALAGHVVGDYFLFISCLFLMIFLWSFFNFRMLNADWRFFWMLLIGVTQAMVLSSYHSMENRGYR